MRDRTGLTEESETESMTHESPLSTIWMHPRQTIRQILDDDPSLMVTPLICTLGINSALTRAHAENLGDRASVTLILIAAVLIGPLGGLFSIWLWSHLVRWTGSWIGGSADRLMLKTAIAWGNVPFIAGTLLWLPIIAVFGPELFHSEMPQMAAHPFLQSLMQAFVIAETLLYFYSVILLSNTIAEAQGFRSAWAGFANMLIAAVIALVMIFVVVLTIVLLTGWGA